ncbi:M20/M25/M40 family metallo-hydrolase [Dickeya sp. ws52]|uniref:M20/M25/M40 family metallo-hydrolase n=1 Tax=Dickeya sp. ws52 TaxID=2576377 RepID=UPI00117E0005|nr:M20/M25/M40 family metallo-hydrolase [Dickeya sp. ws52]TYL41471.1 M20/M25/M40 family metallo-hydrolase [Dickeya sp. ws52]
MSRGKKLLVAGVLGALTMAASVQAQQWIMTPADAQGFAKASFPEYLEGLTLSNDTDIAADIQRNLNWLDKAFQKRGFSTQQLANGAHPMLYAELGPMQPNRPTVLFLMHFDGQSVTASDWTSDPWKPTLKIKDARGIWMPQPNDRLMQPGLDPEWRVFGRSASDGKGVISVFLTAVDAIKSARIAPTVNIKVLLDSEAERGSPHLTAVVNQNAARLKNDGVVIFNGAVNTNNKPVITFGYRGSIQVDMTVFGPDPAAHSGAFGNVIINPVQQLAALLAGLKDADGRVTLPGFYDRVKLTDDERKQLALLAPPPGTIESRYGVTQLEKMAPNPVEAVQYPSLDVIGLRAGDTGRKAIYAIPSTATASINIRTVPETSPDYLYDLLKKYVVAKGFYVIRSDSPSLQERNHNARLISMSLMTSSGSSFAVRTQMASPLAKWAIDGVKAPNKGEPEKNRMLGVSPPINGALAALKNAFAVVSLVNADNNAYGSDENMRIGNYIEGIRIMVSMLSTPFPEEEKAK